MKFEHEKYGECEFVELTQGQLEKFHVEMKALNGNGDVPNTVWRGNSVRACAKLNFMIMEPVLKESDVDNASPGYIRWLSNCIGEWQAEAMNLDPLS